MVTLTVDKADLVVTVRIPHAAIVTAAKAPLVSGWTAERYVEWEAYAAAIRELNLAGQAMQQTDEQLNAQKVQRCAELDALKLARASVSGLTELVK